MQASPLSRWCSFPPQAAHAELGGAWTLASEGFAAQSPPGSSRRWLSHLEPHCASNQVSGSDVCGERAGAVGDQGGKGQASWGGGT